MFEALTFLTQPEKQVDFLLKLSIWITNYEAYRMSNYLTIGDSKQSFGSVENCLFVFFFLKDGRHTYCQRSDAYVGSYK